MGQPKVALLPCVGPLQNQEPGLKELKLAPKGVGWGTKTNVVKVSARQKNKAEKVWHTNALLLHNGTRCEW